MTVRQWIQFITALFVAFVAALTEELMCMCRHELYTLDGLHLPCPLHVILHHRHRQISIKCMLYVRGATRSMFTLDKIS